MVSTTNVSAFQSATVFLHRGVDLNTYRLCKFDPFLYAPHIRIFLSIDLALMIPYCEALKRAYLLCYKDLVWVFLSACALILLCIEVIARLLRLLGELLFSGL